MIVSFTVPGKPVQWSVRAGWRRLYNPAPQRAHMKLIAQYAKLAMGKRKPMQGAVIGSITFYMPLPISWSKAKREKMLGAWHTQKPDATNLRKLVEDSLNKIVYEDDCQIAYYEYEAKRWANAGSTEIKYWTED